MNGGVWRTLARVGVNRFAQWCGTGDGRSVWPSPLPSPTADARGGEGRGAGGCGRGSGLLARMVRPLPNGAVVRVRDEDLREIAVFGREMRRFLGLDRWRFARHGCAPELNGSSVGTGVGMKSN